MPPSNFKSPFVFIASTFEERGALAVLLHHSNWTWLLWAAPENPRTAPSPGLPGIRVLHRSSICISSSDFPCDGFSRSKPAGASRLGYTRASISKAIRTERKPVDFFSPIFFFLWIMLPSLHEQGNWGHFELLIFLSRTYGDRHVSSGHAERARSCQQISLFIFPFCFFYEGAGSSLATSYTFQFVRLGDKDAFGDVGSVAFQRRKYESLWKWGRRGTPFLHLSSSRHQQLLQRLTEQTSAETRANRQEQTG